MRRWLIGILGLLAVAQAGCLSDTAAQRRSWLDRLRPFAGPAGSNVVALEVATIERPIGEKYINRDLWDNADEQVLSPEVKVALEDNGLRVGQIGGLVPPGLQELLTSERSNGNGRQFQRRSGNSANLPLGGLRPEMTFRIVRDGKPESVTLGQAQCSFEVTPALQPDGKVRLTFLPQIQHGEKRGWTPTAMALPGQGQRPMETYASLKFELTVSMNEYVVVGTRFDKPDSIGFRLFVETGESRSVQRLFAIRAGKVGPATPAFEAPTATDRSDTPPPLAAQAAGTTIRSGPRVP
jgi:hypothetical protein